MAVCGVLADGTGAYTRTHTCTHTHTTDLTTVECEAMYASCTWAGDGLGVHGGSGMGEASGLMAEGSGRMRPKEPERCRAHGGWRGRVQSKKPTELYSLRG